MTEAGLKSSLDISPLVGVLLASLVVVMAVIPSSTPAESVALPPANPPPGSHVPTVSAWVSVRADGSFVVTDYQEKQRVLAENALGPALRASAKYAEATGLDPVPVTIIADDSVPLGIIYRVTSALREDGLQSALSPDRPGAY